MYSKNDLIEICKEYLDLNGYRGEYTGLVDVEMPEDMDGYDEVTGETAYEYYTGKKTAIVTFETIFAHRISKPEEIPRAPNFVLFINVHGGPGIYV